MRKLIISLMASALIAAGAVTGATGIAQASTVPAVTHVAAMPGHAIHRPGGNCPDCRI
jgi:hypothetical protein